MAKKYAAIYLPAPEAGVPLTSSKYGFSTEEEAWEYVYSQGCSPSCGQCADLWLVCEADDETIRLIDAHEL